jgi:hypothetical protein
MARGIWLAAAGLAVTAAAGGTAAALHTTSAPHAHQAPVAVTRTAHPALITAAAHTTGQAAFQSWWTIGGHVQYQRVASDLNALIITDSLQDNDDSFNADARRLVTDATAAARHLPPADAAGYHAAMITLAQAGTQALNGSYDTAFAQVRTALPELAAFNTVASSSLTPAQIDS